MKTVRCIKPIRRLRLACPVICSLLLIGCQTPSVQTFDSDNASPYFTSVLEGYLQAFAEKDMSGVMKVWAPEYIEQIGGPDRVKQLMDDVAEKYAEARIDRVRCEIKSDKEIWVNFDILLASGDVIRDEVRWSVFQKTDSLWKMVDIINDYEPSQDTDLANMDQAVTHLIGFDYTSVDLENYLNTVEPTGFKAKAVPSSIPDEL